MKFAPIVFAATMTLAVIVSPGLASAQTLEPSAQIYTDLANLQTRMQPTLNDADRWAAAASAGLPAQAGEIETIESDLLAYEDQASALQQQTEADGIDPHVQRAAQAMNQEIRAFFAATYMADLQFQDMRSGLVTGSSDSTMTRAIQDDLSRFSALANVARNEMDTYAASYNATRGSRT